MEKFLQAIIIALIFEGIGFALFPGAMRKALLEAASLTDQGLRSLGGAALAFALVLLLLARLLSGS